MIAITGANGQLGQLVIQSLLQKTEAANLVALVRDPENADELRRQGLEVRRADYDEADTLKAALRGVSRLLLISSNAVGQRVPQHKAVIEAAREAEVSLFVYTSILQADTSPLILAEEHKETETLIRESGLPAVILRNGWYTENYTQSLGGVMEAGAVAGAAQQGRLHTAARKDYAEAAAVVLTSEIQAGQIYELAGDKGFTLAEYAAEISRQSGRDIPYRNLSAEAFAALLVQIGLPEGFAAALADSEHHAADGWLAEDGGALSRLIGRPTTPLADSVREALASL